MTGQLGILPIRLKVVYAFTIDFQINNVTVLSVVGVLQYSLLPLALVYISSLRDFLCL